MPKRDVSLADMSNAAKARLFAKLIGHLAAKYGNEGEIRLDYDKVQNQRVSVGFVVENGELIIAADMDHERAG